MQKTLFSLLLIIYSQIAFSQQNRFIYIQTENKQPFYVKLDKKVFSSASSGYVIIPKLIDGIYTLSIGFPKNEWPTQTMQCTINKKDAGYLLKNFGDKGWGLFNLQTMDVIMAGNSGQSLTNVVVKETQSDPFSNMLSDVVNDPSIKETVTKVNKPSVVKQDVVITAPQAPVVSPRPIVNIKRTLYNANSDGTEMIYLDASGDKVDTIRVFIPSEKINAANEPVKVEDQAITPQKEAIKEENRVANKEKFLDIQLQNPNTKNDTASNQQVQAEQTKSITPVVVDEAKKIAPIPTSTQGSISNINCKTIATDEDFLKLRKKMAAADNEDDMVASAKKAFKTKCFSTEQVKNLSFLFLKDEGKYQFFDAVYPYVSDQSAFETLQSQLKEEYYINRFKVMIH